MATDNELMDAVQAAEFLGVHIQTQRKLAKQKRIPAFKVGREWRFRKEALIEWADEQAKETGSSNGGCEVLIIDDDEKVCKALAGGLTRLGCVVRRATGGVRGFELVTERVPDLILLDLKMPDMTGPMFLEKLRETHPRLPVVIVTGYPGGDLMIEASRYAPLMVLAKPAENELLERTVRMVIGPKTMMASAEGGR